MTTRQAEITASGRRIGTPLSRTRAPAHHWADNNMYTISLQTIDVMHQIILGENHEKYINVVAKMNNTIKASMCITSKGSVTRK
jgi:hypothetical protein